MAGEDKDTTICRGEKDWFIGQSGGKFEQDLDEVLGVDIGGVKVFMLDGVGMATIMIWVFGEGYDWDAAAVQDTGSLETSEIIKADDNSRGDVFDFHETNLRLKGLQIQSSP